MAAKKETPADLEATIEKVIVQLLGCDTAPHEQQMQILDRALKLAELKKKNSSGPGYGSGFSS